MERSAAIKNYITSHFAKEDPLLEGIRERAKKENLPKINVSPNVGKLLYLLIKIHRPKRILEIGTLAGYSAIWMAKALEEDGELITIEVNEEHIAIAERNISNSNLSHIIKIKKGDAALIMDELSMKQEIFDFIFIDADKDHYLVYLEKALALSKAGTLILSDNLIPKEEKIGEPDPADREAQGIYTYNQMIASNPRLESILIPTIVGNRGRIDAIGLSLVKE